MIRCDEPMKKSKEKCYAQENVRWVCAKDCEHCVCAMFKKTDGTWEHLPVNKHDGFYERKGAKYV